MKFNFSFTCLLQTGHTALQRAAAEGHLEIVKTLLENGISVDHQDEVVSDKNYEVFDANIKFFVINIMRGLSNFEDYPIIQDSNQGRPRLV